MLKLSSSKIHNSSHLTHCRRTLPSQPLHIVYTESAPAEQKQRASHMLLSRRQARGRNRNCCVSRKRYRETERQRRLRPHILKTATSESSLLIRLQCRASTPAKTVLTKLWSFLLMGAYSASLPILRRYDGPTACANVKTEQKWNMRV